MKTKLLLLPLFLLACGLAAPAGAVQLTVDATKSSGELDPFWASQIVHPTESLLTAEGKKYVQLLKDTGAARQYIRIYNQPETAIRVSAEGKITYDWSKFDEMAGLILATGNKLKVVFFAMPRELAVHPESVRKRPNGAVVCTSPPKDYKQWEELCADFTRHVLGKYGLEEVKQWTFRCWNEPDGGFWYKGDLKEYLKLYDHFAKGVKGVCPDLKIGGPALTSTGTYNKPQHFKFFLEHVARGTNQATGGMGAPIDFLSIHTYGGSSAGGGPGRKYPEVNYLLEQQIRYADMRDEYPGLRKLPLHVEEWGESSGGTTGVSRKPSADIRNSQYGAAFLVTWVERHIRLRQAQDRQIGGFTFCASGYEGVRTHDFMGFRTLDTKNGFHKPLLNGYKLLNKLAPHLVAADISPTNKHLAAFATREANRLTIVVVNHQHDRIQNDGASYPVALQLTPPWGSEGKVELKHWRIDEEHSNAYSAFKKIGSPPSPTPQEKDAVRGKMDLELLEAPRTLPAGALQNIEFQLPCNAVSLIEINKL
jgi:xylan 1,4-beta-xylosidase